MTPEEPNPYANTNGDRKAPDIRLPERSPFAAPAADNPASHAATNPSVFEEPWMKSDGTVFRGQPDTPPGFERLGASADPEHSVWDEPGLSQELSGDIPDDTRT
jgi:hypothetical protein